MGHYHCRGLWEMTPKLLLLILALTASLIAQVRCENAESSGDTEAEAGITEGIIKEEGAKKIESSPQVSPETSAHPAHSNAHQSTTQNPTTTDPPSWSTSGEVNDISMTTGPNTTPGEMYVDNVVTVVSLALALVLTAMVVVAGVLINRKRRREKEAALKEDPYLDAEGREKVPMPMFEDDVPSVMELEMEDLEKWMIKGDGGISMDSKEKQLS